MFCKQCGYEIQDDSLFCNRCGANLGEKKTLTHSNKFIFSKKIIVSLIILVVVIPLGCFTYNYVMHRPPNNVSKEVYNGSIQWSNFFVEHKKNNLQKVSQDDMDKFVEFVKKYKNKATTEEREILDKMTEVMYAYGLEFAGYRDGKEKDSFDNNVLELKKLLNLK
ncbi:zinc-ribbon domain-containing protein [Clostridium tunisiense]|uniref:zinc-ribbon domain-containing protein n=1 Tax=Clostridium tunisiense TaxID=219748 RepID=UPI0012FD1C54|nr:zinc-ribbon domain-containing protein [Clostridium tunisiense]